MKYVLIILALFFVVSCSKGETTTPLPKPTIPEVANTGITATPTPSVAPTPNSAYYAELKARCENQTEDKKAGCSASVAIMERNNFIEVDYDKDGNTLPCPEGMKKNTIRSYGALSWCEKSAE